MKALEPKQQKTMAQSKATAAEVEQQAIEATIAVWQRVKHKLENRIEAIAKATDAVLNNTLGDELRQ